MKSLQKCRSVHASIRNHFNQERHRTDRETYKANRLAALAERSLMDGSRKAQELLRPSGGGADCALDAKLRGCVLVKLRVGYVAQGRPLRPRVAVVQQKVVTVVSFPTRPERAVQERPVTWTICPPNTPCEAFEYR